MLGHRQQRSGPAHEQRVTEGACLGVAVALVYCGIRAQEVIVPLAIYIPDKGPTPALNDHRDGGIVVSAAAVLPVDELQPWCWVSCVRGHM